MSDATLPSFLDRKGFDARALGDGLILFSRSTGATHVLRPAALAVLETLYSTRLLDGPLHAPEAVCLVAKELDLPVATRSLVEAVDALEQLGLLAT